MYVYIYFFFLIIFPIKYIYQSTLIFSRVCRELRSVLENSKHSRSPLPFIYLTQILLLFEGNIGYEYRYPLARHLHSSRDTCAYIRRRERTRAERAVAYSRRFITRRASERTSRRCRLGMSNDTFARMRGVSRSPDTPRSRNRRAER